MHILTLPSPSSRQDILKGNWDSVIRACDGLQLPMPKAIALYEQAPPRPAPLLSFHIQSCTTVIL
jgi:hypothetical protein